MNGQIRPTLAAQCQAARRAKRRWQHRAVTSANAGGTGGRTGGDRESLSSRPKPVRYPHVTCGCTERRRSGSWLRPPFRQCPLVADGGHHLACRVPPVGVVALETGADPGPGAFFVARCSTRAQLELQTIESLPQPGSYPGVTCGPAAQAAAAGRHRGRCIVPQPGRGRGSSLQGSEGGGVSHGE
jgi:hypothetical protein